MAESGAETIRFGTCEIDLRRFELRRGGVPCAVEPQVLELLIHLARNPDRLVTRDELIQHVWGGRVVSDTTVASRIKSARQAIGDDGKQQAIIKTVHGRGVRFIGAAQPARPQTPDGAQAAPAPPAASRETQSWPAIAVLPFANPGGDPEQDLLVDGLTDDIITDLSRFRELRVVARDSCFRFRERTGDAQAMGRALDADYLVTGSIRRRGAKLRLNARLVAIESGSEIWAERFDRDAEDVFAMTDELVRTIVGTLVGRVRQTGSALARRKPPANLPAYECVLRGQQAQEKMGDPQQEAEAKRCFEQALALDPDYPRAHAGLAVSLLTEWVRATDDPRHLLRRALKHAEQAVAIAADDHECHETLGWVLLHCKSFEQSEQHYRRAMELNPNSPEELAAMGSACCFLGRPEEGIRWFELAKRVDPYFDAAWYWHLLGVSYFNARRYDEAIAALAHAPTAPAWVGAYVAASQALAGRVEKARTLSAALAQTHPDFAPETFLRKEPYRNPEDLEHLAEGFRRAGLLT